MTALVMTPAGFPLAVPSQSPLVNRRDLAYEVMDGNTSDKTTLRTFLDKIESLYGKARRVCLMDRESARDLLSGGNVAGEGQAV